MVKIVNPDDVGGQLIKVLRSLLGPEPEGVGVLGNYQIIDRQSGDVIGSEPAIAFQWRKEDSRIIRQVEEGSGIECVLLGEVKPNHNRMRFGATQLQQRWRIRLDQYDPQQSLGLAINTIYSHPLAAPLQGDEPQVRDRMQKPDGGIQPARAILVTTVANYQPALF